jgi:hypothetical protein
MVKLIDFVRNHNKMKAKEEKSDAERQRRQCHIPKSKRIESNRRMMTYLIIMMKIVSGIRDV